MSRGLLTFALLGLLGTCSARMPSSQLSTIARPNDVCDACMDSVKMLEDLLCDPYATQFVEDFVDKQLCPETPNPEKCHNLATGLIPVLIQWFKATATPATVCSSAGACGVVASRMYKVSQPLHMSVHESSGCAMCKFVAGQVKSLVEDPQVMQQLNQTLLQVCGSLPKELAQGCTSFVEAYEPMIASFLHQIQPEELCNLLGVCSETMARYRQRHAAQPVLQGVFVGAAARTMAGALEGATRARAAGPSNDACDMCKVAVSEAHTMVTNPVVQADLLNYTKTLCEEFPSFADACKEYVDDYAPVVFSLMARYLKPDTLCVEIGMCQSPSKGFLTSIMALLPARVTDSASSAPASSSSTSAKAVAEVVAVAKAEAADVQQAVAAGAGAVKESVAAAKHGLAALLQAALGVHADGQQLSAKYSSEVFRNWVQQQEE